MSKPSVAVACAVEKAGNTANSRRSDSSATPPKSSSAIVRTKSAVDRRKPLKKRRLIPFITLNSRKPLKKRKTLPSREEMHQTRLQRQVASCWIPNAEQSLSIPTSGPYIYEEHYRHNFNRNVSATGRPSLIDDDEEGFQVMPTGPRSSGTAPYVDTLLASKGDALDRELQTLTLRCLAQSAKNLRDDHRAANSVTPSPVEAAFLALATKKTDTDVVDLRMDGSTNFSQFQGSITTKTCIVSKQSGNARLLKKKRKGNMKKVPRYQPPASLNPPVPPDNHPSPTKKIAGFPHGAIAGIKGQHEFDCQSLLQGPLLEYSWNCSTCIAETGRDKSAVDQALQGTIMPSPLVTCQPSPRRASYGTRTPLAYPKFRTPRRASASHIPQHVRAPSTPPTKEDHPLFSPIRSGASAFAPGARRLS